MADYVAVSVQVPKESKEVVDALCAFVEHFKAGKSLTDAAALLPAVMVAVDGAAKLPDEVRGDYDAVAAYAGYKVLGALKGPQAIPL